MQPRAGGVLGVAPEMPQAASSAGDGRHGGAVPAGAAVAVAMAQRDVAQPPTGPPRCCTHLVSFWPQDAGGSLQEEGRGQGASGTPETEIFPGNATQHPPIPATSRVTGWSQPQMRPPALPTPSWLLGSDPTTAPAKQPRPRAKKPVPDPGLWLRVHGTHGRPRRSSGSRSSRAALEPETGQPQPGKGESHSSWRPQHPPPPRGVSCPPPAEPWATQPGLARPAAPQASADSAAVDPAPAGDSRHNPLPAAPRSAAWGAAGTPLSPYSPFLPSDPGGHQGHPERER